MVLIVKDSTFSNDDSGNAGGAVANAGGMASVTGSTLDSNSAGGARGGAISSFGSLSVLLSTLNGNTACYGGGIELFSADTSDANTVTQSTLSNNHGCDVGGGLDGTGSVTVTQSTLSGNSAPIGATMEIEGSSSFVLSNSTVSANTANPGEAAVQTYACSNGRVSFVTFEGNSNALGLSCHDVSVTGTIFSGSTGGVNCLGAAPTETTGYNLDSGTSCALGLPTDLTSTHPRLGCSAPRGSDDDHGPPIRQPGARPRRQRWDGLPGHRPARDPPPAGARLRHGRVREAGRRRTLTGRVTAQGGAREPSSTRDVLVRVRHGQVREHGQPETAKTKTKTNRKLALQIRRLPGNRRPQGPPEGFLCPAPHTSASWRILHGPPVHDVFRTLGHAKMSTTLKYCAHPIPGTVEGYESTLSAKMPDGKGNTPKDTVIPPLAHCPGSG